LTPDKPALRALIRSQLDSIVKGINDALRGKHLRQMKPVLARIGRGGKLPHWFQQLKAKKTLPNLDGKTVGSVIEMLLVAVLETQILVREKLGPLRVNPARGVDLPDLDLGVKSPSENFCTSEPFFSAYERLLGGEHDVLVLLTDYQSAKDKPPLRLQIIDSRYLLPSQIADENLCRIARTHRSWLLGENEHWTKKMFRFLAFVNQSDWRAKQILKLLISLRDDESILSGIESSVRDFELKNKKAEKKDKPTIAESELEEIRQISTVSPLKLGVIDAADNWVMETLKDAGRAPNDNEWQRLKTGPLDGMIGMSFALQWRYNFGRLFGADDSSLVDEVT